MPDEINENGLLKINKFLSERGKTSYSTVCCLDFKFYGQSLMSNSI